MAKTRRHISVRYSCGSGGSGIGLRIPSSVAKTLRLRLQHNRNRNRNRNRNNKPKLPTKRKNIHPNLTNNNVENVYVVNTNTDEWRIYPGEENRYVPKNLQPNPKPLEVVEAGPGVRVFKSKR
jgi:hypothetical protein